MSDATLGDVVTTVRLPAKLHRQLRIIAIEERTSLQRMFSDAAVAIIAARGGGTESPDRPALAAGGAG